MRALWMTAAAIAALAVSSCDINTGPPKAAKVECNCTAPAAAVPPAGLRASEPVEPVVRRIHHRYAGGHRHVWRAEYAEYSVITYDYHSDSHSYYEGGGHDRGYAHGDGGRGHGSGFAEHDDDAARLHPWHGYDVDCPDDDR